MYILLAFALFVLGNAVGWLGARLGRGRRRWHLPTLAVLVVTSTMPFFVHAESGPMPPNAMVLWGLALALGFVIGANATLGTRQVPLAQATHDLHRPD